MRKLIVAAGLAWSVLAGAESLSFIGTTDKNPLEYALNETMTFTVTLVDKDNGNAAATGKNLRWTLTDDGGQTASGTATSDQPLVVTHSMTNAGFTRLKVEVQTNGVWLSGNTEFFDGGAGAAIADIPQYAAPADLTNFWETATNLLYATPFTGDYAPVCTNFTPSGRADDGVAYYLFELPMPNDTRPATGILAMPQNASAKSCGIVATVDGYGFGATGVPAAANVLKGEGYIYVAITRHGEYPVATDAAYYTAVQTEMGIDRNGNKSSYCWRNNDTGDARDTDFYKMLMRDLRALQYAKSLPAWNGTYVKTTGGSMGGYQSIGMASLDKDVTECVASIPWCADLSGGAKFGRMTGWRPPWTETLGYVDLKNIAQLCTCGITFTAGLGDYVCPPSGEVLLYRNLCKPKKVTYVQNMGHGSTHGPNTASYSYEDKDPEPEPEVTHRTLDWTATSGNWSVAANWQDAEGGTNAVPRDGDIINAKNNASGQKANNDLTGLKPYRINVGGGFHTVTGNEVTFEEGSWGIYNSGYMYFNIPLALQGTNTVIESTTFLVCAWPDKGKGITSADGNPCGLVKRGSGSAGIEGGATVHDYTGWRYVFVEEGNWCFGVNRGVGKDMPTTLFPTNLIFTFAKAGTGLMMGGDVTIEGLVIRETGTAVGAAHGIKSQSEKDGQYGTLTITGDPEDDVQVFTGTVYGKNGFVWAPDADGKEFVFKGGVSSNTGKLGVRNGTLRLTDGATFTALSELEVSGGASAAFVVDTAPSKALTATDLKIGTGAETVRLAAGVTLAATHLWVAGVRQQAGTYTSANTTWIKGEGTVTVAEFPTAATMVWTGDGEDGLWSDANNWTNATTGVHEVPVTGDLLTVLASGTVTVDLAAGTTFAAPKLLLGEATVLSIPAGVTLVATEAYHGSLRIPSGTYTSAAYVTGGGTLKVETMAACHLKWSGLAGDKKWSSANNWVNQTTGLPDVPQNGDTLTIAGGGNTQNNDITDLKPYKIIVPSGYSNPGGNPLIFEEGSWGIDNSGFMYYCIPTIVRAKKITVTGGSQAGYTTSFRNDQGNTFDIEKTGSGLFAFKTGAGGETPSFTGLHEIFLKAGTLSFGWQGTGQMYRFSPGIHVAFDGENTKLNFDQNTTFTNFVIRETTNAVGKTHTMGVQDATAIKARTLTIGGAPDLTPMTYTGDILSPLSFAWVPDNATNEFVFSGTAITCTNTITAGGGVMRLADGASFKQLGALCLKGGALTTFAVDSAPATAFHVKDLVLETGLETMRVATGVQLAFDTLTVAGTSLAAGVYVRTGRLGGTAVSWMRGDGYVCVGGAEVPIEPSGTAVAANWTAQGEDTSLTTDANWEGGTVPDLSSGLVAATFAAGAAAQLPGVAKFKSLALNAPGNWAFTAADAAFAYLGSGGLTTAGTGKTYELGWPIVLWSNQFWNIGKGDTVRQNALLDGEGACLVVRGGGTLDCNAVMGGVGHVIITNATVNLNVDNALGSASDNVDIDMSTSKLYFNGVTVNRTIRNFVSATGNSCLYVKAGTTNVLNGDLNMTIPKEGRINMGKDSSLRIKGHLQRATTAWFNLNGSGDSAHRGTIHLDANIEIETGSAVSCGSGLDLYLNAPSNQLGGVWFWFNQSGSGLHTTAPYAFAKNAGKQCCIMKCGTANADWYLHDCDQELAQWGAGNNFRVWSDRKATVHVASDSIDYVDCVTNNASFRGGASVSFEGTKYFCLGGTSTSTGTVRVAKGELRLLPEARWADASEVEVAGGTLKVAASETFGSNTVFRLSSAGKLDLASGVKIRLASAPVFDGEPTLRPGTYGSSASSARYRMDNFFTGAGVLRWGRISTAVFAR